MALSDAGREKDKEAIARASTFLKVVQLDEAEGYDKSNDWGYGHRYDGAELRADLSKPSSHGGAHDAGVPANDETMQRAIIFLQRLPRTTRVQPKPVERETARS